MVQPPNPNGASVLQAGQVELVEPVASVGSVGSTKQIETAETAKTAKTAETAITAITAHKSQNVEIELIAWVEPNHAKMSRLGVLICIIMIVAALLLIMWLAVRYIEPRLVFQRPDCSDGKHDFDKQALPGHIKRVSASVIKPEDPNVHSMLIGHTVRYFLSAKPCHQGIVILFHGNACLASDHFDFVDQSDRANMACALVEYPGYAGQKSWPSQQRVLDNAILAFDHIVATTRHMPGRAAGHVVLFGQSLGSCVATYVAMRRSVATLILASCFPSIPKLVNVQFLDWFGFLNNQFDASRWAKFVQANVLVLHAQNDQLVSLQMCLRQASNFKHHVFYQLTGANHNNMAYFPDFWKQFTKALEVDWFEKHNANIEELHTAWYDIESKTYRKTIYSNTSNLPDQAVLVDNAGNVLTEPTNQTSPTESSDPTNPTNPTTGHTSENSMPGKNSNHTEPNKLVPTDPSDPTDRAVKRTKITKSTKSARFAISDSATTPPKPTNSNQLATGKL